MWHGFDIYGLIYIASVCSSPAEKPGRRFTYTSVSAVCSSALLGSLVDLDVLHDQVACIKTLGICVCLCVLEETEKEFGRLDWPSRAGHTELLACNIPSISASASAPLDREYHRTLCSTSSSSSVSSHGDGLLVLLDILQELDGALQLPAVDCLTA